MNTLTRGQAAEKRRKENPPRPRVKKTDKFEEEVALAAKKLFEAAKPKRTQPKLVPRGGKRVPKKV